MLEAYVLVVQEYICQMRWKGCLGKVIRVMKGTRQGELSSPFLFNICYQDMVRLTGAVRDGRRHQDKWDVVQCVVLCRRYPYLQYF